METLPVGKASCSSGIFLIIGPQSCIVVTGGSGFVGGALVRRLLHCGATVRIISRGGCNHSRSDLVQQAIRPDQLEWVLGDLAIASTDVDAAFCGATHVFHVAGLVDSTASSSAFEAANVQATQRVCALALANGVAKLVYVSTCDVFGLPIGSDAITEQTDYRPWGESYPDTKIRATQIVKAFQARGLQSSIVYPGWVYGPGDRAFLPALVTQLASGLMPIWSPRGYQIHLVYIEDLVDALMTVAQDALAANDDFLILDDASGVEMTDLCERIAAHFGFSYRKLRLHYAVMYMLATLTETLARVGVINKPMLTTTDVKSFGHHFRYSAKKAGRQLGWSAHTPFDAGINAALVWHGQNLRGGVPAPNTVVFSNTEPQLQAQLSTI